MQAKLLFQGLGTWMEEIEAAGKSVDGAVAEIVTEAEPFIENEMKRILRSTSEAWTGKTDATIETSGVQREGNYIFVEATAGGSDAPQAFYKEFGTTKMPAEPFLRPTFRGHRLKNQLKVGMKRIAERYGLK